MSIYAIGFVVAIILYVIYALKEKKSLNKTDLILAIAAGLSSWIGVIVLIAIIKF
jgi:uncharacterized membrane protein